MYYLTVVDRVKESLNEIYILSGKCVRLILHCTTVNMYVILSIAELLINLLKGRGVTWLHFAIDRGLTYIFNF